MKAVKRFGLVLTAVTLSGCGRHSANVEGARNIADAAATPWEAT